MYKHALLGFSVCFNISTLLKYFISYLSHRIIDNFLQISKSKNRRLKTVLLASRGLKPGQPKLY